MAEVDGIVHYGEIVKGARKVVVRTDDGEEREYSIPKGLHVTVQEGERVRAGDAFTDGPKDPHKILEILGERELQEYLLDGIQEVYRLQGVNIHDKHIEVIIRQMMRWIKVEDPGDTEFIVDEQVDRFRFVEENERVLARGRRAGARPAAVARHHQGLARHRVVHLGRELPGDDARADRGLDLGQGGLPARPQGERDHGSADPGGNGPGRLPGSRSSPTGRRRWRRRPPRRRSRMSISTPIASPR